MNPSKKTKLQKPPANFRAISLGNAASLDFNEVLEGLKQKQKTVSPKFFYDARGSELFNAICTTEAYYPTRTECGIYDRRATEIANEIGVGADIVEFGPGDMSKVRLLLDALRPRAYFGVDVSAAQLEECGPPLAKDFPWLDVIAVCGDFGPSDLLEEYLPDDGHRLVFFPGSTIGNFDPVDARAFLSRMRSMLGDTGAAIVGVDLRKPAEILNAAYNDRQGYTQAFNLNLLTRLNRDMGADFDESRFRHKAFYNEELGRVEMHLVSMVEQQVRIGQHIIHFAPGETIHTENSWKYSRAGFTELVESAGFVMRKLFTDEREWFGVFVLSVQ